MLQICHNSKEKTSAPTIASPKCKTRKQNVYQMCIMNSTIQNFKLYGHWALDDSKKLKN